ncbi:LacI family DNA-binding transcriptional regulator [Streptomyces hirsutus]|uniref:LacI family DNA-binding transcriptional regulator n=1 Tax=Streptomyces hirsutus TaxID=35620 RepID=UPI00340FD401
MAQHAGVDVSVVSRLLSGDPRLSISQATRERVLAAVKTLDYRPNLAARALRTSRGGMAAFVVPEFTNAVYARVIAGAHRRAKEEGYSIVVGESTDDIGKLAREYRARGVEGILLAGATLSDEAIRALGDAAVPIVVVNRLVAGTRRTAVVDYTGASELAADHLTGLGHRDIAVIAGPKHLDTTRERIQAFARRAKASGARIRQVTAKDFSGDAGLVAGRRMLARGREATAVFAPTLMLAVGMLAAAHEAGVAVPEDLSLIALHDAELAKFTWPPLTTVAMPMTELGGAALDHLLKVLAGQDPEPSMVVTPPELIMRGSTARPA